jgi:hypothetical protein
MVSVGMELKTGIRSVSTTFILVYEAKPSLWNRCELVPVFGFIPNTKR